MSVLENRQTIGRCACVRVCVCTLPHPLPQIVLCRTPLLHGTRAKESLRIPRRGPRLYSALDTISSVPRGPCRKEELRRMLRGGGELAAESPVFSQDFEICNGTNLFSSDASQTSQNTKIYPGLYKLYPTRRNHWEKKKKLSAPLLTYMFDYIFKIRNSH